MRNGCGVMGGLSALLAVLGAATASADVVSQTQSVSNQAISPSFHYLGALGQHAFPQWNPTVTFAQFDPALGTLLGVTITVQTGMNSQVLLTGDNPGQSPFSVGRCGYTAQWHATVTAPGGGATVIAADDRLASTTITDTLGFLTTSLYTVPGSGPSTPPPYTVTTADLPLYTGSGTVPLALTFDALFTVHELLRCSVRNRVFSSATVTVEYHYTPVPSPGAAAALGLCGLAAARRRR